MIISVMISSSTNNISGFEQSAPLHMAAATVPMTARSSGSAARKLSRRSGARACERCHLLFKKTLAWYLFLQCRQKTKTTFSNFLEIKKKYVITKIG